MVWESLPFRWTTARATDELIDGVNLASLPQDQTIKTLVKTVINGNATERGNAMYKIGLFGALAEEAVPLLIEALKDEDDEIRWCAIATLGRIGPVAKSSVLALKVAMEDQYLRSKAEEALKRIISHRHDGLGTSASGVIVFKRRCSREFARRVSPRPARNGVIIFTRRYLRYTA